MRIRGGVEGDLEDLVRIYNHYVTTSHVTFDIRPFPVEARRAWFEGFSASGPHRLLVAEADGGVIGYASSSPFKPKPAYFTSVETTIYLDPAHHGRGLGRELYTALLAALSAVPEVHRAYGGIALPNEPSVRLHEALGFRLVGTFREAGFKFDRFWDVCWYEKAFAARG